MALFPANSVESVTDSGSEYNDLTVYRCGKMRVLAGRATGSHSADTAIWELNTIDRPSSTVRIGFVGSNKSETGYIASNGKICPSNATSSTLVLNAVYFV